MTHTPVQTISERAAEELTFTINLLREANARLARLVATDPLTHVANRRRLEEVLDAEWHDAQEGGSIGFLMIDIDQFKIYNDEYGHVAGDHCLQHVADKIAENTRSTDLVARYGGEEFAIVMPGADVEQATEAAERVRNAVVGMGEPFPGVGRVVTVSIGVAAMVEPDTECEWEHLITRADTQLYIAKRDGRNRVSSEEIEEEEVAA